MGNGYKLVIDSWVDISFLGKHAYVGEFVEVVTVTATGLSWYMDHRKDLPIANVLYTYGTLYETSILLKYNNTI